MAEILLHPNDFQNQIDSFKEKTSIVAALKYPAEKDEIHLRSIDKYLECIEAMNELIEKFSEFAQMDGHTMQKIKAKWMGKDQEIATKTVAEIIQQAVVGKK